MIDHIGNLPLYIRQNSKYKSFGQAITKAEKSFSKSCAEPNKSGICSGYFGNFHADRFEFLDFPSGSSSATFNQCARMTHGLTFWLN